MAKTKKKSVPTKKKATPAKKVFAKKPVKVVAKKAAPKKAATPKKSEPVKKTAAPKKAITAAPNSKSVVTKSAPKDSKKLESFLKNYLKPLDDRMVVLVEEMAKMTPGGLYIPDTVTDVSGNYHGKVMAIGRGHMNKKGKVKPLDVSIGDRVVFSQFSGSNIEMDGGNIMIIRESDVLGIEK